MQSWVKTGTKDQRQKAVTSDYNQSVTVDSYENKVQDSVARMFEEAQEAEREKKRVNDLAAIEAAKPDIKKFPGQLEGT